jgi:hypothetical protein
MRQTFPLAAHVFSAKGAVLIGSLGQRPQEIRTFQKSALKARFTLEPFQSIIVTIPQTQ